MNTNGLILWEGPSAINGKPIAIIATGLKRKSKNDKIGKDTVQIWYLPRDVAPHEAIKNGADESVCGDCKHRPSTGMGSCYVITFQAPLAVWKAYKRGSYPQWDGHQLPFIGRTVRFGAWGDPASAPAGLLKSIRDVSGQHMAYTHQWAKPEFAHLMSWCMASVDSLPEYLRAKSAGWRTFRVRKPGEPLDKGERGCPSADESTALDMDCNRCGGCDGLRTRPNRVDYSIQAHGGRGKRFTTAA